MSSYSKRLVEDESLSLNFRSISPLGVGPVTPAYLISGIYVLAYVFHV